MDTKKTLKSKKLRVTDFRSNVLTIFSNYENAISYAQIENDLGEFDRITLYRTLKSFKEKGIIHEITLGDLKLLALCDDTCDVENHQHHHIHFHCKQCSEVYCVDVPEFPTLPLSGFSIDEMEIQATGTCEKCKG